MSSSPANITFGIVTDCQFADADPNPPNFFRASTSKLGKCIRTFNRRDLNFIVNLGDSIDHGIGSFEPILAEFKSARAKFYHLLGNHDFAVEDDERLLVPTLMGIPGPPYFRSFSISKWRFICLDGNELSLVAHPSGSEALKRSREYFARLETTGAFNAERYNGGLGDLQMDWLDEELQEASDAGQRAIIFNHFPVLPVSTHSLWDAEKVADLLGQHDCAVAHLNGHLHRGSYTERDGIHYLTLRAMLESPDKSTFAIAEISGDQLKIEGFGNQESYEFNLKEAN